MIVKIDKCTIGVVQGDIADQNTEAIVNAANNHLWMGAGVAGAIKRKGGIGIEQDAVAQGPVEVGDAVITGAGALPAKFVIHAAVMGQDLHTNAEKIQKAMQNTLRIAGEKKIKSVSFPAFGTGVGGFSVFHCAKIMILEAVEFLTHTKLPMDIRFVLFDRESYTAFEEELKLQFSSKRH